MDDEITIKPVIRALHSDKKCIVYNEKSNKLTKQRVTPYVFKLVIIFIINLFST